MNNKITQEDINLVKIALNAQPFSTASELANKIEKILKNYEELKENYIEEKLQRYKLIVPNGDCPYVYFNFDNGVECGELDCSKCKYKFFQDIEKEIRRLADKKF